MEKVLGIGGLFFRAKNPKALSSWYADALGVDPAPNSYDGSPWRQKTGATVFAPFAQDTEYFDRSTRQWRVNCRVGDLDAAGSRA